MSKEERMARLYSKGMGLDDIGGKFNCTGNTVRNKLSNYLPTARQIEEFKRDFVVVRLVEQDDE